PLVVILICNRFISTQAHEQAPAKEAVSSSAFCPVKNAKQFCYCYNSHRGGWVVVAVAFLRGERGGFDTLNGRWLRPDGGYVLEIRAVDPSGKVDGVYLNPKPINIAKAEATRDGSTTKVFVELRAPNYPGSTYTLAYDREHDQLHGTYFQAALQQKFDVGFVRVK